MIRTAQPTGQGTVRQSHCTISRCGRCASVFPVPSARICSLRSHLSHLSHQYSFVVYVSSVLIQLVCLVSGVPLSYALCLLCSQCLFLSSSVLGAVACGSSLLLLWAALNSHEPSGLFSKLGIGELSYGKVITSIYLKVLGTRLSMQASVGLQTVKVDACEAL